MLSRNLRIYHLAALAMHGSEVLKFSNALIAVLQLLLQLLDLSRLRWILCGFAIGLPGRHQRFPLSEFGEIVRLGVLHLSF
eukprot:Skav234259  [mRNA]  locus=scaffold1464:753090:753332:- [translate_table: standard]